MSLPYQNNDKQLLTDLCACTDFITCSWFLKRRQVICIVLISPLWSSSAGVAHFCNTMLPAKTFYLEAFCCCLSLGFFFDFIFLFTRRQWLVQHFFWGHVNPLRRTALLLMNGYLFFSALNRGDYVEKKKEIKSNKGTAQVLCGWVCTCRTLHWPVRRLRGRELWLVKTNKKN